MRIAAKIGLSAAAAALVIGPLLGMSVFFEARSMLQEHIVHEQLQMARSVMREIDTALYRAYRDVSVIAADDLLRGSLESPGDRARKDLAAEELEERERLTGPWEALTVFDVSGRAVFATKPLGDDKTISAYPSNRQAFQRALNGEIYYSDRVIRRRAGLPVVIMAAPVHGRADPRKVVGVVVAHYSWSVIPGILDQVDPAATVHLLDRAGAVIGKRSDDLLDGKYMPRLALKAAQGETGGYAITSQRIHGAGQVLAVELEQGGLRGYRGSGWRLLLEQPLDRVFAPIKQMAVDTALWVFVALLALAVFYVVLGRRLMSPLAVLVNGVRQVAGGNLDEKVAVPSKDEFGELADDFNIMVDRLQERTRQLLAAQDELVKKEKLAMLGQVADTVGHELRNPLGVMNNAVYYLQAVLSEADETTREYLGIIKDEIADADRIVSDLLDAVRIKPPCPERVDLAEVLGQTLRKCGIPSSVTVSLDIPPALPAVRADPMHLHQIFWNLITNGVEAMPQGGALAIRVEDDAAAHVLRVSIQDNGIGMTPEQQAKLFQPMFTTKARRVGLGLAVVKNLTQINGASVAVESAPGKGSTFTVTLPGDGMAEEPVQQAGGGVATLRDDSTGGRQ